MHVAQLALERLADLEELGVGGREHVGELAHGTRRAHAGHYVFTLRVHQELAVEHVLAGGGVAREGHPGARLVAGVAVHHGLHVDRRAPAVRDVVEAAVGHGAVVVPAAEHGRDRAPELLPRVVREVVAGALLHRHLELDDQVFEVVGVELRVELDALGLFGGFEDLLEGVALVFVLGLAAQHDVAVHAHKAPVAVVGETWVGGRRDYPLHGGVVETQVEDGVHHARHAGAGAGAHAEQQRVGGVAERLARVLFEGGERGLDLFVNSLGVVVIRRVVVADLGGDREAGRNGQADASHLGEVGTLAAEQFPHVLVALAEPVDVLGHQTSWLLASRRETSLADRTLCEMSHVCAEGRRLNSPIWPMRVVIATSCASRLARTAWSGSITSTSSK